MSGSQHLVASLIDADTTIQVDIDQQYTHGQFVLIKAISAVGTIKRHTQLSIAKILWANSQLAEGRRLVTSR